MTSAISNFSVAWRSRSDELRHRVAEALHIGSEAGSETLSFREVAERCLIEPGDKLAADAVNCATDRPWLARLTKTLVNDRWVTDAESRRQMFCLFDE